MNDFTPEQEATIRRIVREELRVGYRADLLIRAGDLAALEEQGMPASLTDEHPTHTERPAVGVKHPLSDDR